MTTKAAGAPGFFRRAPVRALLPVFAVIFFSCGDGPSGPGPDGAAGEAALSFRLEDSTSFDFTGPAGWPPSGSGVIARMDSAGRTLQIAGYAQTSGKIGTLSGPEPRFDLLFIEITDTIPIAAGAYAPSASLFCRDLAFADFDSGGYVGTSGTLTLTRVTAESLAGTFALTAVRNADAAAAGITGGRFEAPRGMPLFIEPDTGSGVEGGTIQVGVDTGVTPLYTWGGGPVYGVSVSRAATPAFVVWGILSDGDSIASGVRHGAVVPGTYGVVDAETVLTRGIAYRVMVSRESGNYGWRVFTP